MKFDVEGHLATVERSVSSLEWDGRPARAVTLSRSYPTTVKDLWDTLTNAGRIPLWFLPVSGNLVPGGRYQLEGNAGGLITKCEHLSHFALTWEFGEDVSWVEVRFLADGDSHIRLRLTHTSLLSEHWDTYGPGAVGVGWELGLMGLAIHIVQPNEPKPDEVAFATSASGRKFITGSSERWGHTSVAAGTDPNAAGEAARQTTAFYTGESI